MQMHPPFSCPSPLRTVCCCPIYGLIYVGLKVKAKLPMLLVPAAFLFAP